MVGGRDSVRLIWFCETMRPVCAEPERLLGITYGSLAEVADEEYPDAEAEDFPGEVEIAGHTEFGEAGVGAVAISNQVQKNGDGKDVPDDFAAEFGDLAGGGVHGVEILVPRGGGDCQTY